MPSNKVISEEDMEKGIDLSNIALLIEEGEDVPMVHPTYSTKTKSLNNQKFTHPALDKELLEQTDQPSSAIMHDDVSDPTKGMTIYNTTIVNPVSSSEVTSGQMATRLKEPTTPVEEPTVEDEDFQLDVATTADEEVSTPKVEKKVVEEPKKVESKVIPNTPVEPPKEKKLDNEKFKVTEEDTKKVVEQKKFVIPKPIKATQDDENIDLNISSVGKEEVKQVDVNVEDLFEPFDHTTASTQLTEDATAEMVIPNMPTEELAKYLLKINAVENSTNQEAKTTIDNKIRNRNTYEARAARAIRFKSDQQAYEQESLEEAAKEDHKVVDAISIDGTNYRDGRTSKSQLKRLESGSIIAAKDSIPLAMALIGGLRKVHFYNSGFWCIIRSPLISELHTYYTKCDQMVRSYGRMFGQISYLPADVEISQAGIDLFKSCIVKSNLENFGVGNTFENNLSCQDEDTCLWALASVMFPDGAEIEYVCSNDKCHYIDRVEVDLSKIRYFDITRLGVEALKYCHSDEIRNEADIANYKENILKHIKAYKLSDEWELSVCAPSLGELLRSKTNFISDLTLTLELDDFSSIDDYVTARYFRILSPWVNQITYTDTSTGKKILFKYNLDTITDAFQLRHDNLPDIIVKYMKETKVSYYCYPYSQCPKCGSIPPSAVNGLIPCDIKYAFFTHTTELLR